MPPHQAEDKLQNARETLDSLYDLSQLLQTGLDKQTLSICVGMIEAGANPDSLAVSFRLLCRTNALIKELRRENEESR